MKQFLTAVILALGVLVAGNATEAFAQGYTRPNASPYAPPVFSPYLNLLRRDTNPALNYYGLVKPEREFRDSIRSLQNQVNAVGATMAADEQAAGLPVTGHGTQFQSFSHYYPAFGVQGGSSRRVGPTTSATPRATGSAPTNPQGNKPAKGR